MESNSIVTQQIKQVLGNNNNNNNNEKDFPR